MALKELVPDLEALGPSVPSTEVFLAFLGLEVLLGIVGAVEGLTEEVVERATDCMAITGGWTAGGGGGGLHQLPVVLSFGGFWI